MTSASVLTDEGPRCLWKGRNFAGSNSNTSNAKSTTCTSTSGCTYQEVYEKFAKSPPPRSWFDLSSRSLVVAQEVALGFFLLARHRVLLWEELQQQGRVSLNSSSSVLDNNSSSQPILVVRFDQKIVDRSTYSILFALALVLGGSLLSPSTSHQQDRRTKARQRLADGLWLALLLRFLAAVLRTLTASYASDTVQALAVSAMAFHVLTCDYQYANGKKQANDNSNCRSGDATAASPSSSSSLLSSSSSSFHRRPTVRGGTVSLNAALFTTTLLMSRLQSNLSGFVLVCLSIVMFGFYPDTRHTLALHYPAQHSVLPWLITAAMATSSYLLLLVNVHVQSFDSITGTRTGKIEEQYHQHEPTAERIILVALLVTLIGVIPAWKRFVLQYQKVWLHGPWEIPSAESMMVVAD